MRRPVFPSERSSFWDPSYLRSVCFPSNRSKRTGLFSVAPGMGPKTSKKGSEVRGPCFAGGLSLCFSGPTRIPA